MEPTVTSAGSSMVVLVNMAGSICLLLWGSFSVRSAVEQSFTAALNKLVSMASRSRLSAVMGGMVAALLMQSATATILLCAGLLSGGVLSLGAAMAVILGADFGSALAARVLFIDLSLLPPALLVAGMLLHLLSNSWRWQHFGRILIGLGLMLLSIQWMRQTISPLASAPLPEEWMAVMSSVPWLAVLIVALLTWFAHSSVAVVLVIAALAESNVVPILLCVPMLLGANIGAGLISLPLVDQNSIEARSVVLSNVILRSVLAIILLLAMSVWLPAFNEFSGFGGSAGARVILLHMLFNGLLVVFGIGLAGTVATRLAGWLGQRKAGHMASLMETAGSGLDPEALNNPEQAIAIARREAYRLGDLTESMFGHSIAMFDAKDRSQILRLVDADKEINLRNKAIHVYLSEARRHIGNDEHEKSLDQVLEFSSTMENIGDCISHDLSRLAIKKLDRGVTFSVPGFSELVEIHSEVLSLLRWEINHFAGNHSTDRAASLGSVRHIKLLCNRSIALHRRRLSQQLASSMVTSSIHQDAIRDYLQIAVLLEPAV